MAHFPSAARQAAARCILGIFLLLSLGRLVIGGQPETAAGLPTGIHAISIPGIENAFTLGAGILSGGTPDTDAAFAALARRGVKIVVSVDGARPDLAAARRAGLEYVHLPIGYEGISRSQSAALAWLATRDATPLFIHCHHGKHRGPAAVAIAMTMRQHWSEGQREAWMRAAGTSPDYAGLYRSVREFTPPDFHPGQALPLPETAETPARVEAMVRIDEHLEKLQLAAAQAWMAPPVEAAALLRQQYRELARAEGPGKMGESFAAAEQGAAVLHALLESGQRDRARCDAALQAVAAACTRCHREHRNQRPAR